MAGIAQRSRWLLIAVVAVAVLAVALGVFRLSPVFGNAHLGSPFDDSRDASVKSAVRSLAKGISEWRAAHHGRWPARGQVRAATPGETYTLAQEPVGLYLHPWPTNPFAHRPMALGDSPGEFEYFMLSQASKSASGRFRVVGFGPGGVPVIILTQGR